MSDTAPPNFASSPGDAAANPNVPGSRQIREFNDRGTLWLLEDPANLRGLLQIVAPELAARLDVSRAERVNRSFIPADLHKEESDLIFRIAYRADDTLAGTDMLIYLLLEHQSKPDPLMGLRLLAYLLQLWESQRRQAKDANVPASEVRLSLVVPVVFYTGTETWESVPGIADLMDIPPALLPFVPTWRTLFLNLRRTGPEQLTRSATAVGYALRVLQAEREPLATLEQVWEEALSGLEDLEEEQAGQWVRVMWYLAMLALHRRNREESPGLMQRVQERARASKFYERGETDIIMITLAQEWEARGEARGEARAQERMATLAQEWEARGEARGEARATQQATQQAVETVLRSRFGAIPPSVTQALEAADVPTLLIWLQRAAQAATLEEAGIR